MARFFVGQRVRLVRYQPSNITPIPVGDEGRVTKLKFFPKGTPTTDGPMLIDSDCEVDFAIAGLRSSSTDNLEPILPDGHRAGDYSLSELLGRCRQSVMEAA